MENVIAVGFLLGLASSLAIVLAIANSKLKVFEDPRIDQVQEMLPGSNCGACGLPGCRVFAEKAVAGDIQPSGCTVGGVDAASLIADYLGVDAGDVEKKVARLMCAGGTNVAIQMADYEGQRSCRAATAVGGGGKGCRYGCLGFGDCQEVCDFDAIVMGPTGLPTVDVDKCTACGDCVDICPKGLFEILPLSHRLLVQCKSELEGDEIREFCKVACTACGKCVADAAQGLLKMKKNLPVMNSELLNLQSPDATRRCPTGAITWVEGQQFQNGTEVGHDVVSQIGKAI
ncbi:MAG: 4Fe-4S binding protein [Candidatus Krumholzibacteria bacterium]|nr:4Fe-4S binding protein [Candidatus Krumholzibacteria bacterium]